MDKLVNWPRISYVPNKKNIIGCQVFVLDNERHACILSLSLPSYVDHRMKSSIIWGYTKILYLVSCMTFQVTMVTYLMTLLMNEFTRIVVQTCFLFIHCLTLHFLVLVHLNLFVMKYCYGWLKFGWKKIPSKWKYLQHCVSRMPQPYSDP